MHRTAPSLKGVMQSLTCVVHPGACARHTLVFRSQSTSKHTASALCQISRISSVGTVLSRAATGAFGLAISRSRSPRAAHTVSLRRAGATPDTRRDSGKLRDAFGMRRERRA
eukprot:365734-Chlamydomonas_euryale.AAC.34